MLIDIALVRPKPIVSGLFQFSIGDAQVFYNLYENHEEKKFQFSIGDAGFRGVLYVWVFKFFVCVLACWCLGWVVWVAVSCL